MIKIPFKGCELAIVLHIIRKTYGFQKKQDEISISQFMEAVQRGRPTVVKALKNLQLVNMVKLVKKGNYKKQSNIWMINKYPSTWRLVKTGSLVKGKPWTSKDGYTKPSKDGLTHKRKKEIYTKEISKVGTLQGKQLEYSVEGAEIIKAMESVDPKNKSYYGNKTQRAACDFLIREYGKDRVLWVIEHLSIINKTPYVKKSYTPNQLKENWQSIKDHLESLKTKKINKNTPNFIL